MVAAGQSLEAVVVVAGSDSEGRKCEVLASRSGHRCSRCHRLSDGLDRGAPQWIQYGDNG